MSKQIKTATNIPNLPDDEAAANFFEAHDTSAIWNEMKPAKPVQLASKQTRAIHERYVQRKLSQILGLNAKLVAESRSIARRNVVPIETQLRRWIVEGIRRELHRSRSGRGR